MLIIKSRLVVIQLVDKAVKVGREDDSLVERSIVQSEIGIDKYEVGFYGGIKSEIIEELS